MTTVATSYPPRIVSFKPHLQGVRIAGQRDMLWPCHAFKVSIPSVRRSALNIFEDIVLRLCRTEKPDSENLAEITCLDLDIVKFIQSRLVQLDLLSARLELTPKGSTLLETRQTRVEEFEAATAYLELIGGNLLPVVTSKSHLYAEVTAHGGSQVNFSVGSAGKKNDFYARLLNPDQALLRKVPGSNEVYRALKSFRRLHDRFYLLTGNGSEIAPLNPSSGAITVHEEGELVFLHCKAIVQEGNPDDFLVSDPFGYGFSSILKDVLSRRITWDDKLNDWLIRLKERGLIERFDTNVGEKLRAVQLPPGFSSDLMRFPEIRNRLWAAEDRYQRFSRLEASTTSREAARKNLKQEVCKALYDALEWTFRQVLFEHRVEDWEKIFSCQSYEENDRLLLKLAAKIGFAIPANRALLRVSPGKFRAMAEGTVEMQPLLALAIAGAVQDNQHPLHRLAANDSNCLSFFSDLKTLRDEASHGADQAGETKPWDLAYFRERTHQIIMDLYPFLRSSADACDKILAVDDGRSVDQQRLKARIRLDTFFGVALVQGMPRPLVEELTKIELWDAAEGELCGCVNSLASALQTTLYTASSEYRGRLRNKEDAGAMGAENAEAAGFLPSGRGFPPNLRSNKGRVLQACSGSNVSLGTNLIAFFVLLPRERLGLLAQKAPRLVPLVDRLVGLRGHGNKSSAQLAVELKENEMELLKETTFKAIKLLMENML